MKEDLRIIVMLKYHGIEITDTQYITRENWVVSKPSKPTSDAEPDENHLDRLRLYHDAISKAIKGTSDLEVSRALIAEAEKLISDAALPEETLADLLTAAGFVQEPSPIDGVQVFTGTTEKN